MTQEHKPVIETIINSAALALFAFGVNAVIANNMYGYLAMLFGMLIEFFKYAGRKHKYW